MLSWLKENEGLEITFNLELTIYYVGCYREVSSDYHQLGYIDKIIPETRCNGL